MTADDGEAGGNAEAGNNHAYRDDGHQRPAPDRHGLERTRGGETEAHRLPEHQRQAQQKQPSSGAPAPVLAPAPGSLFGVLVHAPDFSVVRWSDLAGSWRKPLEQGVSGKNQRPR